MTEQTHPDWLLIEAGKQSGWATKETCIETLRGYVGDLVFRSLCDALWKLHEAGLLPAPVDRKLLCVEEAMCEFGWDKDWMGRGACYRAIELWEEGFGK
jgi:hypothetical protein